MAFKRVYSVPEIEEELYATVLVECENCGDKDILSEPTEIEFVTDTFNNSTSITSHTDCQLCGQNEWVERAEHISLGYQNELKEESFANPTISSLIHSTEILLEKLKVARENDFEIKTVLSDEQTIVLWKS